MVAGVDWQRVRKLLLVRILAQRAQYVGAILCQQELLSVATDEFPAMI